MPTLNAYISTHLDENHRSGSVHETSKPTSMRQKIEVTFFSSISLSGFKLPAITWGRRWRWTFSWFFFQSSFHFSPEDFPLRLQTVSDKPTADWEWTVTEWFGLSVVHTNTSDMRHSVQSLMVNKFARLQYLIRLALWMQNNEERR